MQSRCDILQCLKITNLNLLYYPMTFFLVIDHFANDPSGNVHKAAIYAGTFIGGVTFTGSLTAFGKLQGLLKSAPLSLPGKNFYNIAMGAASAGALGLFMHSPDPAVGLPMLGNILILLLLLLLLFFLFFFSGSISSKTTL